jgi:hypothetical protein
MASRRLWDVSWQNERWSELEEARSWWLADNNG